MSDWVDALRRLVRAGEPAVLVSVVATRGSAPRGAGAKMLVTADAIADTIGGGRLEFEAMARARDLLAQGPGSARVETVPLGPELGQCCGGVATLMFEPLSLDAAAWVEPLLAGLAQSGPVTLVTRCGDGPTRKQLLPAGDALEPDLPLELREALQLPGAAAILEQKPGTTWVVERLSRPRQELLLFGAGHVGRALVAALAPLPFAVTWIDGRPEAFPSDLPENATLVVCDPPRLAVERAAAGAMFLVMTHSHGMDLDVCDAVLRRDDTAYLGLIGSKTKRARFEARLLARGHNANRLADLICPIGLPGIEGKEPAIIAASLAVDLLRRRTTINQGVLER